LLGKLARNTIGGLEQVAKCEPAPAVDQMDAITPALGVQKELADMAPAGRVLQEWDWAAGAECLGAPLEGVLAHWRIIL
jgi:hypothetical protein